MSNNNREISLVTLDSRHLKGALKLSQEFSWPYRLEDWQFAAQVGEGVVLERDGEVLGTALWWSYGERYATAGMIIVTAKAQGGGQGSRLFNALLEATKGRNLLLNSTEEGLALYRRRGFEPWGMVHQHQAVLAAPPETEPSDDIRPATAEDLAAIQVLDERAIGMPRQQLVAALFDTGKGKVLVRDDEIAGYAICRRFGRGYVVGPVAAGSVEDAKRLICAHLVKLGGQFVRLDVYADDGLSDWLAELGLPMTGQAVAMARGTRPATIAPLHMYAVANQSFS
ncbi:GNAT family N-acetyltransferase [uncultured Hoeflea sp.]|uniref:GNAT family N-acetyltransferase n=1 Tax=uncultured Hoeflea sp. TaxID=538666 RepID=UPI0030DD8F6F